MAGNLQAWMASNALLCSQQENPTSLVAVVDINIAINRRPEA